MSWWVGWPSASQEGIRYMHWVTGSVNRVSLWLCCEHYSVLIGCLQADRYNNHKKAINTSKLSGHYMYRPVVTMCTTSLTLINSSFCPLSEFMCFVWIWEQTAIISLCSIDWLVFITETECVYCAVRATFYVLPTQCIYVFCVDPRKKQRLFHCTALTGWFL